MKIFLYVHEPTPTLAKVQSIKFWATAVVLPGLVVDCWSKIMCTSVIRIGIVWSGAIQLNTNCVGFTSLLLPHQGAEQFSRFIVGYNDNVMADESNNQVCYHDHLDEQHMFLLNIVALWEQWMLSLSLDSWSWFLGFVCLYQYEGQSYWNYCEPI